MMNRLLSIPRFIVSLVVCIVALLLPYHLRVIFFKIISKIVHLPFKLFGWVAKFLLKQLSAGKHHE